MQRKYNRYHMLEIETRDAITVTLPDGSMTINLPSGNINHVTLEYPLTVKFDISRNNLADANTATFEVYNLNEATRNRIFKDPFAGADRRGIQFTAGYQHDETDPVTGVKKIETLVGRLFNGEMRSALSYRRGTEWITEIECYDGAFGMANGNVSLSISLGTEKKDILKKLIELMPGISGPVMNETSGEKVKRGVALMGNCLQMVKDLADGQFCIDDGKAYILKDNECINGEIQVINTASGLIGSPKRAKNFIELDMMFEPRLKVNQWVRLESPNISAALGGLSEAAKRRQGEYKIVGLKHRGTISGAVCEDVTTTVTLQLLTDKDIVGGLGV